MASASMVVALQHASEVFGYTSFNETQIKAINGFVCGQDVFVMVPTGGGKCACFPLVFDKMRNQVGHILIVVSPLTALMKDQVR